MNVSEICLKKEEEKNEKFVNLNLLKKINLNQKNNIFNNIENNSNVNICKENYNLLNK